MNEPTYRMKPSHSGLSTKPLNAGSCDRARRSSGDAPGQRVALELVPRRPAERQDLVLQLVESRSRQEILLQDKAVALEGDAILRRDQPGQSRAPPLGKLAGQPHARDMQPRPVEPRAADDRIVAK